MTKSPGDSDPRFHARAVAQGPDKQTVLDEIHELKRRIDSETVRLTGLRAGTLPMPITPSRSELPLAARQVLFERVPQHGRVRLKRQRSGGRPDACEPPHFLSVVA